MNGYNLVKTDKNGTKVFYSYDCTRCGGAGYSEAWKFTGCTCYKCGGSGRQDTPSIYKEYTPEYEAVLQAKREAKRLKEIEARIASADEFNSDFLVKNFNGEHEISIILGDTYSIKEDLKEEGCRFTMGTGWYAMFTDRPSLKIMVGELIHKNDFGEYEWNTYAEIKDEIDCAKKKLEPESNFQFEVGERVTMLLTVEYVATCEIPAFGRYGTETLFINNMRDPMGNVFIWKTTSHKLPVDTTITIKGTIKEHSEYKGQKQTVLTRCKISG